MIYRPHPDGFENTAFKIRHLFNVSRLSKEDKEKLNEILELFSKHLLASNASHIKKLKEEVEKYKKVKELLK